MVLFEVGVKSHKNDESILISLDTNLVARVVWASTSEILSTEEIAEHIIDLEEVMEDLHDKIWDEIKLDVL